MPDPRPVVVAVDFSDCSHLVVAEAAAAARQAGAELVILHVLAPGGPPADAEVLPPEASAPLPWSRYLRDTADAHMASYAHTLAESGVDARTRVEVGPVVETILAVADELDAQQLMMGTHGRTGLARLMMGSVAQAVAGRSTRPVSLLQTHHRPSCEARSCGTCQSHFTESTWQQMAEADG